METKNPPPTMTEKIPTTKPPTRSSAVCHVSSQGAIALIHEKSITVLHPTAHDGMHRLPLWRHPLEDGVLAVSVEPRGDPPPILPSSRTRSPRGGRGIRPGTERAAAAASRSHEVQSAT